MRYHTEQQQQQQNPQTLILGFNFELSDFYL